MRLTAEMDEKERIYGSAIRSTWISSPRSNDPLCKRVALGLDRLVMLATGATHIEQVLWAPVAE
jgi:lysyl-tRNA synthetase class 2